MAYDHDEIRTAVIEALTMTRVTCDHKALEYMAAHMDDVSVATMRHKGATPTSSGGIFTSFGHREQRLHARRCRCRP